jgi:hypothetical protein
MILTVDLATIWAQDNGAAPTIICEAPHLRQSYLERGRDNNAPGHATHTLRRLGGQVVLLARGDPCHCHCAAGGILPLASVWVSTPSPGRSRAGLQKITVEPSEIGMTSSPTWISSRGLP